MCQQIETDKMVAYEQAVKAYQFQVTRYNTWMNYYALFVGALFVSFYMIICYSKSIDTNIIDPKHLLIFIAVLGIIASTCWMASLIGNCAWMNNYIKVVKENEKAFFSDYNSSHNIYQKIKYKPIRQSWELRGFFKFLIYKIPKFIVFIIWFIPKYILQFLHWVLFKNNSSPQKSSDHIRTYISTQKVTQWFVGAVLATWIYIFICLKYGNIIIWRCDNIGISIIAALVIWVVFKCIPLFLWSDNLKGMKPEE